MLTAFSQVNFAPGYNNWKCSNWVVKSLGVNALKAWSKLLGLGGCLGWSDLGFFVSFCSLLFVTDLLGVEVFDFELVFDFEGETSLLPAFPRSLSNFRIWWEGTWNYIIKEISLSIINLLVYSKGTLVFNVDITASRKHCNF